MKTADIWAFHHISFWRMAISMLYFIGQKHTHHFLFLFQLIWYKSGVPSSLKHSDYLD